MKRLILFFSLCLCLSAALAQTADERVGHMLNTSDWFALEREYPALKDSVHAPFLRVMAESLAAVYFGRDDEAVSLIDSLVRNYQGDIGFDNTKNMVLIQAQTEARRQRYAKAAEIVGDFVSQVKAQTDQADLRQPEAALHLYGIRSKLPPSTLERPARDVAVSAEFREVDLSALGDTAKRGYMLCIPANVNGRSCRAVLDTGCPTTFCSIDYARKVGARLLPDTINVNGAGKTHGFFGVIDSISVGGMTFRNAEVVCVDDAMVMDSLLTGDFVIGLDFMRHCGEMQVYPREGRVVFPAKPSPLPETGRNICLTENNGLRIETYVGGERLKMMFDTGNNTTTFSASYYVRHKQDIDKTGTRVTRLSGGIGRVGMKTLILLPPLTVRTGGTDIRLGKACVDFEPNYTLAPDDGNAGLDIIHGCRKATLNLKDMFLKIEN